ncbi:MAG: hypothetical protein RLZZ282_795 [Verrucomicrobiota bacterium]|jgi:hypothetical protein
MTTHDNLTPSRVRKIVQLYEVIRLERGYKNGFFPDDLTRIYDSGCVCQFVVIIGCEGASVVNATLS